MNKSIAELARNMMATYRVIVANGYSRSHARSVVRSIITMQGYGPRGYYRKDNAQKFAK